MILPCPIAAFIALRARGLVLPPHEIVPQDQSPAEPATTFPSLNARGEPSAPYFPWAHDLRAFELTYEDGATLKYVKSVDGAGF